MEKRAKVFFIIVYIGLFLFMRKMIGFEMTTVFFLFMGAIYFLMVVLPRLLGDKPLPAHYDDGDEGYGYRYSFRFGSKYNHKR